MLITITLVTGLLCLLLMLVVLVQNPKGGGIDSTFGGTSANQMIGASKSTGFVEKLTWYLAAGMFVLCFAATLLV